MNDDTTPRPEPKPPESFWLSRCVLNERISKVATVPHTSALTGERILLPKRFLELRTLLDDDAPFVRFVGMLFPAYHPPEILLSVLELVAPGMDRGDERAHDALASVNVFTDNEMPGRWQLRCCEVVTKLRPHRIFTLQTFTAWERP